MDTQNFYGTRHHVNEKFITMIEALNAADGCKNPDSIVNLPPESGDQNIDSDIEDVPDDFEEGFEPAGVMEIDDKSDEENDDELQNIKNSSQRRKKSNTQPKWRKNTDFDTPLTHISPNKLADEHPELLNYSCYQLWREFFTDEMMELIKEQTNIFANRDKGDIKFMVEKDELSIFLGILIHSGYKSYPQERTYWSNKEGLGCDLVSKSMSRNRFQTIKSYIHMADNQCLQEGNKVAKISPLYSLLNLSLIKFGVFHSKLSIDESMVPYYGKHSAKMFIRGKPIRFGYKIWAICGSNGYPYHLQIYQGKEYEKPAQPLGSRVINELVQVVLGCSSPRNHSFFFDNFFTSYTLLCELREKQVMATGTIRDNRTAGAAGLMKEIQNKRKNERGSYDYRCDGRVLVCKWVDNAVVGIASNHDNVFPLKNTRRRVRGMPNQTVNQPSLIHAYNQGMGGVDMMDKLLETYRPKIRGKKWYFPLFLNALNVSIVAAWRAYQEIHPLDKITHFEFRYEIALCLIKSVGKKRRQELGGHTADIPGDIRCDGTGHKPESVKQGRCKVCKSNCRLRCLKCNVRLHRDKGKTCWDDYHTSS